MKKKITEKVKEVVLVQLSSHCNIIRHYERFDIQLKIGKIHPVGYDQDEEEACSNKPG